MKTKPLIFNILFVFFTGIAFSLPLQVAGLYEHSLSSWSEWQSILMKLTPLNWAVIIITLLNGFFCYQALSFIKYTIPLSILVVAINNFFVGSWGVDFSFLTTWIATVTYAVLSYSYAYTQGLEAIDHPEKQWWKIPKRLQRTYPVWMEYRGEKKLLAKTFDISKSGAFISAIAGNTNLLAKDLKLGESLKILIGTDEGELAMNALVVRKEDHPIGHYPPGLGVRFTAMGLKDNLMLRKILNFQKGQLSV